MTKRKRIVKSPDIRKDEIINVALELFDKYGYANTPVEEIIQTVGIAKGTFYYYFKTKYDILSSIVEKIANNVETYFTHTLARTDLSTMDKIKLMLTKQKGKEINIPLIMTTLHKPENRELQEKLNIYSIEYLAPMVAQVFRQGYEEGVFSKSVSDEDVQLIMAAIHCIFDSGLFVWSVEKRFALLNSAKEILTFICGANSTLFDFVLNS